MAADRLAGGREGRRELLDDPNARHAEAGLRTFDIRLTPTERKSAPAPGGRLIKPILL